LKVTNNGPSTASNVTVSDPVPAQTSFVSATPSQGSCSSAVSCSLGTLAPGGSATITIVVHVDSTASGSLSNTATVSSDQPDGDSANNSATEKTAVAQNADLLITKSDSPDPVVAGTDLTYTLKVTNNGPSTASNVTVSDPVPAQTSFVSATPSQGSCSSAVSCSLGTLAPGGSATITIVVHVDSTASGSLSNTATVSSDQPDGDSANNSATEKTAVAQNADLLITKSDSPDPVTAGGTLTYTLSVSNAGPSTA